MFKVGPSGLGQASKKKKKKVMGTGHWLLEMKHSELG